MIIGGGGDGLPYPEGDPGALDGAAGQLHSIAGQLSDAAGQVTSAASAATGGWTGMAAARFDVGARSVESGLKSLSGYHNDAGNALTKYAAVLKKAQQQAQQAAISYGKAQDAFTNGMAQLSSNPPKGKDAAKTLQADENSLSGNLNKAWNTANTACVNAVNDAKKAARECASKLEEISGEITDTGLHKFIDMIAGPGAVLSVFGVEQQGQSALKLWNIIRARTSAEASVMRTAEQTGESSYEALVSWLKFQEAHPDTELPEALQELWKAAVPIGEVPKGAAGLLDVLGKGSLVLAGVSDIAVIADGKSTVLDRTLSGVNLLGIGAVASGVEVGGVSVLGAVGASEVVATLIPGVGEVVIAGTAAYLAGEWISQHWSTVEQWGKDIGGAAVSLYHDGEHLVDGAVNAGEHLVSSGEHLVSSGLNAAGHFFSDLNPFG